MADEERTNREMLRCSNEMLRRLTTIADNTASRRVLNSMDKFGVKNGDENRYKMRMDDERREQDAEVNKYNAASSTMQRQTLRSVNEILKIQKERKFGKGLGWLLGIGGLLGWLLTGKKNFLYDMIKGFAKWGILKKPLEMLLKPITWFATQIVKLGGRLAKSAAKTAAEVGVKGLAKLGVKVGAKGAAKLGATAIETGLKAAEEGALKGGAKGLAKIGAKGVAKSLAKKIPILGALFGIFFGIQRIRDGDWLGGILEFASGAASIFPGVGTVISGVIDVMLLARDIQKATTGGDFVKTAITTAWGTVTNKVEEWTKPITVWFTDIFTAVKDSIKRMVSTATNFFSEMWNGVLDKIPAPLRKRLEKMGVKKIEIAPNAPAAAAPVGVTASAKPVGNAAVVKAGSSPVIDTEGASNNPYVAADSSVHMNGLNSDFMKRFLGLATDYQQLTGRTLIVNSAVRTKAEQAALRKKKGDKWAAAPGRSMHNHGYALDIENRTTGDVDRADRMGLLKKHKLHRPLLYAAAAEPWHIEPTLPSGTKRSDITRADIGDPVGNNEVNNAPMQINRAVKNEMVVVSLDSKSMTALAHMIGAEYAKHQAEVNINPSIGVDTRA